MKKKMLLLPLCAASFLLASCSVGIKSTTVVEKDVIVTQAEEVEVIEVRSTITEVYKEAAKSCVALEVEAEDGTYLGSGVIYKKNEETHTYYVVTNAHVIKDATSIKVYDGDTIYYEGTSLGYDEKNDIGVVTFTTDVLGEKREFKSLDIFDEEQESLVSIGETALAIGTPLSLENYNTLTVGVISNVTDMQLTTDAALNPGNSGGGLFDMTGRLIGITNSKTTWTTDSEDGVISQIPVEGKGYAIPMRTVMACIEDIEAQGVITRPVFGMYVTNINSLLGGEYYEQWKEYLPDGEGAYSYVVATSFNTPSAAETAGVKVGDVILKINGNDVTKNDDITTVLYLAKSTDTITLTVYRKSENVTKDIAITWN